MSTLDFSSQEERDAALALLGVRHIGQATLSVFAGAYGNLAATVREPAAKLAGLLRGDACKSMLAAPPPGERLELIHRRLAHHRARVLFRGQPGWPAPLDDLGPSAPATLFVTGNLDLGPRRVAVVGSRGSDRYGDARARGLGERLAEARLCTVSGGAQGIDAAAHKGALDGGGLTFCVLGAGFDHPFPAMNKDLFARIVGEGGALLSEFPPTVENKPGNFPRRNELVAALSEVVVVVQGDLTSGALHTAQDARRLGRRLLAIPGPVTEVMSRGPHALLRAGWARPCTEFGDVLRALDLQAPFELESTLGRLRKPRGEPLPVLEPELPLSPPPPRGQLSAELAALLDRVGTAPVHFDELARLSGLLPPSLAAALTQLEVNGQVRQLPGKRFVRAAV